jgi:TrmH family RNA methyltransferase
LKQISSVANPLIKEVVQLLEKSRVRRETGLFVAEGLNELRLAIQHGYQVQHLFFCTDEILEHELKGLLGITFNVDLIELTPQVMRKIAYRSGVKNAVAVLKSKPLPTHIPDKENLLLLVAESVEKPGNLGALLRSADAAGADAVLICDAATDVYNPNVIRSSVGCVFAVPVVAMSAADAIAELKRKGINVFTTFMENAESIWQQDLSSSTALVVGTENAGLTDIWRQPGFKNVNVPMFGAVDSLNVSVAASLLLFEAARQRG